MKKVLFIISFLFMCVSLSYGATYYVDGTRPNDSGNGQSWGTAKQYIASGIALMSGGDTLWLKNGTYSGTSNRILSIPSGTSSNYTKVYAESDFGVTILGSNSYGEESGPLCVYASQYIEIRGVNIKNNGYLYNQCYLYYSNHIKVKCCSSDGLPPLSNSGSHSFQAQDCTYVLFEDCFAYGAGRYMFAGSPYTVFRRCLARWDYSFGVDPIACFNGYNTNHVYWQNCIAIDGKDYTANPSYTYKGAKGFFNANGGNNYGYDGCIVLNFEGVGLYLENGPIVQIDINNMVIWGIKYNGASGGYPPYNFVYEGSTGPVTINQSTFGPNNYGEGLNTNGAITFNNSIVTGITLNSGIYALDGGSAWTENYNCFYGNTGNRNKPTALGANDVTYDPKTNGLEYIVKIENGHTLKTAGQSSGQIGAEIVYKFGTDGTLYGETGWNTLTSNPLWPFPNEDAIRTACRSFTLSAGAAYSGSPAMSGDRGFCADGETLTHYIMNYLGNGDPYSGGSPLAITTTSLPSGTVGSAYSQSISATGGTSPYTYAVTSGSLPGGLSMSSSGSITGTPTTAETQNFTVTVTDNVSATDGQVLSITINSSGSPSTYNRKIGGKCVIGGKVR